jgi:ribosome-associated toxin RatA of RatAB toxin-antitoxin module
MRRVELGAVIRDTAPETAYVEIARFERFPDLAPHVQSTIVHSALPEPTGRSSWELHFRSGLLRWTEEERYQQAEGIIAFEQLNGDFDEFSGTWTLTADGPDTRLRFSAEFDFGIPSLEGILDPIAERVIKETVAWVVVGMFEVVDLEDSFELVPITTPGM